MPRHPFPNTTAATLAMSPVHDNSAAWADFRERYSDWLYSIGFDAPLYCLPVEIIAALQRPNRGDRAIIDAASASAEKDLLAICRKAHAVGYWQSVPVIYSPLTPPPSREDFEELIKNRPSRDRHPMRTLGDNADDSTNRMAGYVGWLRSEPAYLKEVDQLSVQWHTLPAPERPSFPLGRPLKLMDLPDDCTVAKPATAAFAQDLEAFLDKWGLMQLATWDLAWPQGPLLPNLLPPGAPALPRHGVHIILPLHYPLRGDDSLLRLITQQQQQQAKSVGLDSSLAGLPHHKAYAQMLNVMHVEQIVRKRYGQGKRPNAFVTRLEEAMGAMLGCRADYVQKLRKAISKCKRGERADVNWLRPPVR